MVQVPDTSYDRGEGGRDDGDAHTEAKLFDDDWSSAIVVVVYVIRGVKVSDKERAAKSGRSRQRRTNIGKRIAIAR